MSARRTRAVKVTVVVTTLVAWGVSLWAEWFFDGCRGAAYHGTCSDFDPLEPFLRAFLIVPALAIGATAGVLVVLMSRVRDHVVEERRRDSFAAADDSTW